MTPKMSEVCRQQNLTADPSTCVLQQLQTYSLNTLQIKLFQITADAGGDSSSIPHICEKSLH
jgi:hypothetical protein